ncbi:reverse transcriptase domain-containing protein [Tanacetum coccineum]|uniref:Reverse transcriptase domain-containing protein n=1 Tax=Tanacetum coccineum TaxID=301880 RepID=A0ABQ5HC31_9ASTR
MVEVPSDGINVTIDSRGNTTLWQHRLGHMSEKGMKILASKGRIPDLQKAIVGFCKPCVLGKQKKVSFVKSRNTRKLQRLELVHTDVYGPTSVASICRSRYYVTFIDNNNRMVKDVARDKLDAKSVKCTFIGYGSDEVGYHFWDLKGHKVIRSKDVTFNEDSLYGAKAATNSMGASRIVEDHMKNTLKTEHSPRSEALRLHMYEDLLEIGNKTLQSKWVFRVKEKQDGNKRLVFSIIAVEDLHLEQLDVKTAFLHGDLDEDIYMTQPEGFQSARKEENLVYKLKKSSEMVEIKKLKRLLSQEFEMKDFGSANHILGMSIIRDKTKGTLRLYQEKYIGKVMVYPPLRLEGLPFELEWDPLPNCTMGSLNSYPRLGNPVITPRTLRSFRSLIVPIFAQSMAPFVGTATISPISTKYQILTPVTTTVFSATTPKNTPFAYRASTSANPNPMISPAFVEANYEVLESLLRERRRPIRNKDLRTELEYFNEDYDEEREMEPRPRPTKETTPPIRLRYPEVRRQRERVVGFEDAPNREGSKAGRNAEGSRPSEIETKKNGNKGMNLPPLLAAHLGRNESDQPLKSSLTSVYGGHQPTTNKGRNLPPNGFVTPFVCSIEDYPLPNGLKMPSHIGSYDGKRDLDNFLHLFEGAIRMQKWLILIACHMFTYTLKDFARIWWNSQRAGTILNYEDLKAKFRSHLDQQKKFSKTHLAVHHIKQREGESTRAFATKYTDDTL